MKSGGALPARGAHAREPQPSSDRRDLFLRRNPPLPLPLPLLVSATRRILVMELIEGETLGPASRRGRWRSSSCLKNGTQIAEALDGAPAGDRPPRPEARKRHADEGRAKLLDFGLAKVLAAAPAHTSSATTMPTMAPPQPLTQQGTILGTFQYMAPEQLEGGEADARSDIFAFGARPLRDGDGEAGLRRQEPGEPDRRRSCGPTRRPPPRSRR